MADPSFTGLALWLVPSSSTLTVLKEEMSKLRANNPNSPFFQPHATLLTGLSEQNGWTKESIVQTVEDTLTHWRKQQHSSNRPNPLSLPLTVGLKEVTTRGVYFQCILIALQTYPLLLSLHQQMREAFHLASQPPFFPHISLLYADLDITQAQNQITQMEKENVFCHLPNREAIRFAGLSDIDFVSIDLYDCNGSPDQWKKIASIPFH